MQKQMLRVPTVDKKTSQKDLGSSQQHRLDVKEPRTRTTQNLSLKQEN